MNTEINYCRISYNKFSNFNHFYYLIWLTIFFSDQYVQGENVNLMASMAKLKAGRLAREVTDSCLQFWGGMGYSSETLIGRVFRDLRLLSIGGGADEVMLGIICKLGNLTPSKKI